MDGVLAPSHGEVGARRTCRSSTSTPGKAGDRLILPVLVEVHPTWRLQRCSTPRTRLTLQISVASSESAVLPLDVPVWEWVHLTPGSPRAPGTDETADRRRLKVLNVVDEHTREALARPMGRTRRRRPGRR